MRMNKLVSVITAAAMGLSLLAGCQSTSHNSAEAESQTAAVEAQSGESTPEASETEIETAVDESLEGEEEYIDLEEISNQVTFVKTADKWELPMSGCVVTIPESFKDLKGQVYAYDAGETGIGSDVFHCRLFYVPSPDEDREVLAEAFSDYKEDSNSDDSKLTILAEAVEKYQERGFMPFLDILVFSEDFSLDEAKYEAWVSESSIGKSIDLGQNGSYKYYCLTRDYTSMAAPIRDSFTDEYYDEFMTLVENADQLAANITTTEPTPLKAEASDGTMISFETTDLDGNPVTSAELFAGHKVTMINIWATWCGVCVEEMPGLEELNKGLAAKDCQIIGICDDTVDDPLAVEEAKSILQEKGVTYINLVQTEEMQDMMPASAYPISYFVDSEGRILTSPETGANLNAYGPRIEKALKGIE